MSDAIRALVALSDEADRFLVDSALSGESTLEVVGYSDTQDDWATFLEQPSDVVIVACANYSDRTEQLIDRAAKQRPGRPIVVLTQVSPNGLVRRAFEAGADDVIALPESPETVRFAIQKVLARRQGVTAVRGAPTAPLVCVLGPKGGTGKTLVSSNLAVALAQRDMRVVLVDLDLQFGDIGLGLGLIPERTIYDLAKAGPPYDHDKLDRHLMRHASGVKVLLGPTRPDHASAISVDFLRNVYASLRTMCDIVIVDTPPGFTPEVIATIDVSARDARADGLLAGQHHADPQPLGLAGRDHPRRRLGDHRPESRPARPERPRDPALGERGRADRRVARAFGCRQGVPRSRRQIHEAVRR